jgi:uncharacterized protein (TIGR02246 family)
MKSKFQLFVLLGISAFVFYACAKPAAKAEAVDLEKVKPDIQAMEDAFAAAEKAKDAAGVAVYYSDDAISYGRNSEPTRGNQAIKDSIGARLKRDTTGNTNVYKVVDLFGEGNTYVEIGSWQVMSPAGKEMDHGHYMSYFQKGADGKYKCVRDMNVTSMPAK